MNTMATITLVTLGIVSIASIVAVFYMARKNRSLHSTIVLQQRVFRQELSASTPPKIVKSLPKRKQSFKERILDLFQ